VDKATEDWIHKVANEAEAACNEKRKCSVELNEELQIVYHGCKSVHPQVSAIVDEHGNTCDVHVLDGDIISSKFT